MGTSEPVRRASEDDVRAWFDRAAITALDEDLGGHSPDADITTTSTVPNDTWAEGVVRAKQAGIVCGLPALEATFGSLDARVTVSLERKDGDEVDAGDVLARVHGPAGAILTGERTALNLVGHLSGIATLANEFTRRAPGVEIADTRKTLPGLRRLEKYAVRRGGAANHRFALWDGVLVKDNHIVVAGSVGEATRRARGSTTLPVQVECTSIQEIDDALDAGAAALLLDNRGPDELRRMVEHVREVAPQVLIEASGGVTLDNVAEIASTAVDRISIGALTHSAPALDVSLDVEKAWPEPPRKG